MAGHWAAAGLPVQELPSRIAAATAAERVFGYAEAAAHWQRATELCQLLRDDGEVAALSLHEIYLRALDALEMAGEIELARTFAEDAYQRFASYRDNSARAPEGGPGRALY